MKALPVTYLCCKVSLMLAEADGALRDTETQPVLDKTCDPGTQRDSDIVSSVPKDESKQAVS